MFQVALWDDERRRLLGPAANPRRGLHGEVFAMFIDNMYIGASRMLKQSMGTVLCIESDAVRLIAMAPCDPE
jgi:hypothetical protein